MTNGARSRPRLRGHDRASEETKGLIPFIWSADAGDELIEIISFIKYNAGRITAKKVYEKINSEIKKAAKNAAGRRLSPMLLKFGIKNIHQFNISPWAATTCRIRATWAP